MSSDFYNDEWYDARWESMPPVMRKIAADAIAKVLTDEDKSLIARKYAAHGHDWIHHLIDFSEEDLEFCRKVGMNEDMSSWSAHHGWGTAIRNLLRDEELGAGIRDEDLPPAPYEDGETHRCWDDYYVAAVEAAVGLRPV